ncbi:tRNA-splicing ligase RtcB [Vairimorpha necatrix]|uniref:3'-phosphate/5'-hydroxy nucleic acid ligase n=1 Tax=Vairimorpha necatrix TaxID=6039 RepID=A0AAX4J9S9_9MICR
MINISNLKITIPKSQDLKMNTDCIIYASKPLHDPILQDKLLLTQLINISKLPTVSRPVIGLPDLHQGYVFPIGSVTCFDLHNNPLIIPGGVGYDINCGVRCLKTNLHLSDLKDIDSLVDIFDLSPVSLPLKDLNSILDEGLNFLVKNKLITVDNLEFTESNGKYQGNSRLVSQKTKGKGINQFGSLGSGNHYAEIQYVEKVVDKERCEVIGLREGQIVLSVHSGSRGLGHNVCKESLIKFNNEVLLNNTGGFINDTTNMNESVYLHADNILSQEYLSAMSSACNYAFANRAMISQTLSNNLKTVFPHFESQLIYDTSHNIAKVEEDLDALVIRKGASRILEPGNLELPFVYRNIGQPVMVGGSMGTFSYIICGESSKTYRSTCHGSGRIVTRKESSTRFKYEEVIRDLKDKNIYIRSGSKKGIVEEAPECYKDIDEVVECSEMNGISKKVCRLRPIIVLKDM